MNPETSKASCFNSLQTGKCIESLTETEKDIYVVPMVLIPFKRESASKATQRKSS